MIIGKFGPTRLVISDADREIIPELVLQMSLEPSDLGFYSGLLAV